jgi:SAM-dependent methyltransferase
MLERARAAAEAAGVMAQLRFTCADFNTWQPATTYHAVLANQSLHHVVALEHLFDAVAAQLAPQGRFIIADMIGRNGHQRWPEARAIIDEFWATLPPEKRRNRLLGRIEHRFQDWDCSVAGFEGVRAQDILPLLIQRFQFEMFLPFGNLVDPFTDRAFGHNFSAEDAQDRAFIDRVHARDEAEISAGRITPTHMFAVLCREHVASPRLLPGLTPAFCVRKAG